MNGLLQHQAQRLAETLPPLLIEAERVAETIYQGIHGRRRAGVGETFWQFRRYEIGDPIDRIDWRQSARTDKVFVREREWEAAQTAYLWADCSGSMDYASSKNFPTKAERAQLLLLALASLLLRGGEIVQWLDPQPIRAQGKNGLRSIAERMQQKNGPNTPPALQMTRQAHVILCSDFLMSPDEFAAVMKNYAAQNQRGVLVHILDPSEECFDLKGRVQLIGKEGENPILLQNAAGIAAAYQDRMAEHKARLAQMAKSMGWFVVTHVTRSEPQAVLLQMYNFLTAERGA